MGGRFLPALDDDMLPEIDGEGSRDVGVDAMMLVGETKEVEEKNNSISRRRD